MLVATTTACGATTDALEDAAAAAAFDVGAQAPTPAPEPLVDVAPGGGTARGREDMTADECIDMSVSDDSTTVAAPSSSASLEDACIRHS